MSAPTPQAPDLYKDIYEFAANQVSESRAGFERYYKITIGGMVLLATLAVGIFFWLVGKQYSDIANTVQTKTDNQLAELQQEVRARIEDEFKTEKMRTLIHDVAVQQTKSGLGTTINRAVARTVESRVAAEGPQIARTVQTETKKATAGLFPIIDKAVKEQTTVAAAHIQQQMAQWQEVIKAGNLAILARNGIGSAYDELQQLAIHTSNQDVKMVALSTRNELWLEMDQIHSMYQTRQFRVTPSKEELIRLMNDPQPLTRKAAIDTLVNTNDKSIIPQLIHIYEGDQMILVRTAAYHGLEQLTGQKFEPLDVAAWKTWWAANKPDNTR